MFGKSKTKQEVFFDGTRRGIYLIYDCVAEKPGPLYEAVNDAVAQRSARQALRNVEDIAEYKLYCVGTIGDDMQVELCETRPIEITRRSPELSAEALN